MTKKIAIKFCNSSTFFSYTSIKIIIEEQTYGGFSTEFLNFLDMFLKKFGKLEKIELIEHKITVELEDEHYETLKTLLTYGTLKRKLYRKLLKLLNEDYGKFKEEVESLGKEILMERI
ncbi:hypothetical protein J7L49_03975 [Candidatus Bathyarchaeota archaeon]|nr:hypothetical protein [Candidatus Bathyarchaeota archaeon]